MKTQIICFVLGLMSFALQAQAQTSDTTQVEKKAKVEGQVAVDVVSQYIWRGLDSGSLSVQPTLGIGYKGLSLTAWGNVGIANWSDTKEFDLTLAYTIKGFNVGITDYWFSKGGDPDGRYFVYHNNATNHVFEANVGYDFGFLNLQWFTNFAGNDLNPETGKRDYSSYFEVSAPFRLITLDWTAAVGVVPYASNQYGTKGFHCTNVNLRAVKTFNIKNKVLIPLQAQIIFNPCANKVYFVAGVAIQPQL
ncbi:MAG: hypothetical protein HUK03_10155 [Bacteroidaceae bacterium]|nr:hypothetical protein [Bacteroidaceae bacterium]